ncbi:MAG: T9SS type A sorting domain-containing protein [Bacteroidetes bacterium]|nr:T9SS type A sorting domain-containing protein [Bacteroidota bacterium]
MRRTTLIMFLGFFCFTVKAQLSTGEIPYSWVRGNETTIQSVPEVRMSNLDMETLNREDLANEGLVRPYRFGFSHDVNFNLENSGVWTTTADSGRLWNLRIYSPDALSLNLLYDKFWLPEGAKFFIYSEDMQQHIGAFTSENNKGNKDSIMGFATGFLFTNSIVLEYYEPKGIKDSGIISISHVVSGYRYVYDIVKEEKQLRHNLTFLNCHNDVNCLAGNGYENEKDAVAYMVMWDLICTGTLLNTTANDNRPVFFSANHCFEDASISTAQWIFYWNYEAPCGGVVNINSNNSTTGANVLARSADTDFLLLNLIEHPAMNPNISLYFLGWDRTTSPTGGAVIHHPSGAQKKISLTNSIVNQSTSFPMSGETLPANKYWKVGFHSGALEGGSSGSSLLNQNNRVIGSLCGGTVACPPKGVFYYGRFDVSWSGNSSSARLSDWLDPLGTNQTSLIGKNCDITLNNRTYNLGSHLLAGCTIEISNTTIESNTTVRIHGQQSVVLKPGFHAKAGSNVRITAGGGIATRGTDTENDNEDAASMLKSLELAVETTEISNVDFIVYPNPNDGNFKVKITGEIQPYTVEIFNNLGGLLGYVNCNDETVNINRTDLKAGIYYVKITMNEKIVVKKIIVQ